VEPNIVMKSNRPVTRVKVLFHTQPRFATLTNMVASIALSIALGIALGIAFWASTSALGGDWPQLLGPNRDGNAADELPAKLGDLKARWEHKVGAGFAGPAIVDGKVLVFHRIDDEVIIECLNAKTGKQQWEYRDATKYSGGYNSDNGPRCVPVVADGRVYAFGSDAELHCVRLDSGAKVWKRRLSVDYRSPDGSGPKETTG
jgi:outer membrane protein assembly factor BamB